MEDHADPIAGDPRIKVLTEPHMQRLAMNLKAPRVGCEVARNRHYDRAGVLRDMFQHHLLQLLMVTAMEPPLARLKALNIPLLSNTL